MRRFSGSALVLALSCALVMVAGLASAQTTSTRTVNFEVVSINGTTIVYKDLGTGQTKEYIAQPDAKFTMDGKEMGLADLKPGMQESVARVAQMEIPVGSDPAIFFSPLVARK